MHSVMLLIVSFGALAGLYVLLDAPFTAVTQIIVYAGAIMVLFLFVVMLLNPHKEDDAEVDAGRRSGSTCAAGVLLSLMLAIEVAWALSRVGVTTFSTDPGAVASISSVAASARCSSPRHCVRVRSDLDPDPGVDGRRGGHRAEGTLRCRR